MTQYLLRRLSSENLGAMAKQAKESVYARTLQAAADILGSPRALARYLGVSMADLYAWMRPGALPPPAATFLKAVDLVLNDLADHDAARAQKLRIVAHHKKWSEPEAA
jgi:hypothetical protein